MCDSEKDMADLAEYIRISYWHFRAGFEERMWGGDVIDEPRAIPSWDGVTDATGRTHDSIWLALARLFVRQGIPVRPAMRFVFAKLKGTAPRPHVLMKEEVWRDMARRIEQYRQEIQYRIEFEKRVADVEWAMLEGYTTMSEKVRCRQVIVSRLDLSTIYRFCLATQTKQLDLSQEYRDAAFEEYADFPHQYDIVLGDLIPDDFRDRVRAMAQQTHWDCRTEGYSQLQKQQVSYSD